MILFIIYTAFVETDTQLREKVKKLDEDNYGSGIWGGIHWENGKDGLL